MNSQSQSPERSAKFVAMLGIGLILSLPLLAQTIPVPPTEQSPVNISRSAAVPIPNPPQIDFNYGIANVTLKNTYGKKDETSSRFLAREWGTLKATFGMGSVPEIRLNGVPYDLIQFHFHVPAEHTVNGQRADMEIHLVHLIRNGQDLAGRCASSNRPLLVIGAFINAGGNSDTELQRLFPPGLPQNSTEPAVNVPNVDLRALIPSGNPTWQYAGGLTAPADDCPNFAPLSTQAVTGNFPEAVQWFIYSKSLQLPRSSINRFNALFPEGDSRELKALNERMIFLLNRNGDN
jgi:carbonic anhydrase